MNIIKMILTLLISVMMITGCTSDKPNNEVVKNAVIAEMQKGVPERWVKAMVEGINPKVDDIEIVEWGKYSENNKTWPVKIKVVGSATLNVPFGRAEERQFDAIGDFYFFKDDFDKWKWEFKRPGLFGD